MVSDYENLLKEFNVSNNDILLSMEIMDMYNLIEIKSDKYYKSKSKIQGFGLFANKDFKDKEFIGIVNLKEKRTTLARFTNHSDDPNMEFDFFFNDDYPEIEVIAYALKDIKKDTELLVDYRHKKMNE
jgi:SET domain-containing protein|tara:strand:+ start:34 stop:417 length:384 start_codon:yes stop_codon:yes gene_type:complete